MSDDDRDPVDDDPRMRSMRAVWLAMRDEEPPQAGLSALLAAARDKAETMRPKASWWQRTLATLRRPPVLALATVVVLIGGAVALTMRGTAMQDETAAEKLDSSAPQLEAKQQPPEQRSKEAERGDKDQVQQAPAATIETPPPPAELPPPVVRRPSPPRPATREVAPTPPAADRGIAGGGDEFAHKGTATTTPKAPPKAEKKNEGGLAIATDGRTTSGDVEAPGAAPPPPPPPQPPTETAPATAGEEVEVQGRAPRGPSTAQLVQQCETAAARGDCAAARATAERIKKLDATVYKERVKSNAKIARCLN